MATLTLRDLDWLIDPRFDLLLTDADLLIESDWLLLCDCERKAESDSTRLAERDLLNDWLRLCDCDPKALSDSARLADLESDWLWNALRDSFKLADRLPLKL